MFDMFLLLFLVYLISLLLFPVLRITISSKYYVLLNITLLLALFICINFLFWSVVVCNNKYFLAFDLNNYYTNLIDGSFTLSLAPLSFFFTYLVTLIGFTTNIYMLHYFKFESDESVFAFWVNAFVASMLILVLSTNFYSLFLGWELIGLTSFFLINFWKSRRATLKSSFKAFTFNLVSDVFMLAAFVCFYKSSNTADCDTFLYLAVWENLIDNINVQYGLFFLTICAGIKSVQIGGHLWLPDSMEAPVPASSLIHSATLVSAGIYLICKFNILYVLSGWVNALIFVGALSAAYGGVVAAAQTDLKKLLAYSTMSHCGFLWVLASSGDFFITVLYLFLHGIFKASSFYCAGSFIRMYGTQDSRWMGNSHIYSRLDTGLLLVCGANLAGLPFTIGYFFKWFFFKLLLLKVFNWFSIGLLFIGMLSSLLYYFRLVFYVTFDFYKNIKFLPQNTLSVVRKSFTNILSSTTKNHILSVLILFFFSIVTTLVFSWFYTSSSISFDSITLTGWELLILNLGVIYNTYYIYFYFVYLLLVLLLLLVNYRRSIFGLEQLFITVYFFFVIFLFLKCEVIL